MNEKHKGPVESVKFVLRLPPPLHQKVKRNARANRISMNAYLIRLVDEPAVDLLVKNLIQRLEEKKII